MAPAKTHRRSDTEATDESSTGPFPASRKAMTEQGLLDIPPGHSILPILAQKEHELQERIQQAEADAEARVEEAREQSVERLRREEEAIRAEEERFVEEGLAEARKRAAQLEQDGTAEVEDLRRQVAAKIESAAEVVVNLVLGREPERG